MGLIAALALGLAPFASGNAAQADLALSWPEVSRPPLFSRGQRIGCIGDSITRPGQYITYLYDYYVTRLPDQPIRLYNLGIGGDTLKEVLARYDDDIRAIPLDSVMILMGMNDAARGAYTPDSENNPSLLARRTSDRAGFDNRLTTLIGRLKTDNIAPILCTPTCYDETTVSKYELIPKANRALQSLAEVLKIRALADNLPLIELNEPLLAANASLQTNSQTTSIIGGDRVHPLNSGQAIMAWAILRQQQAPKEIAEVIIDARAQRTLLMRGCEVSALSIQPNEISYNYQPKSLPLPRDHGWAVAASCTTLTRDFNQEWLKINSLADGVWLLKIGEIEVGQFTSSQLAEGINLANQKNTPQLQAADHIHELNLARSKIESKIRGVHYIEKVAKIPSGAKEDVWQKKIANYLESANYKNLPETNYFRTEANQYVQNKSDLGKLFEKLETATQNMYAAFPRTAWPVRLIKAP